MSRVSKQLKIELHSIKCCVCGEEATDHIRIGTIEYHFCHSDFIQERKLREKGLIQLGKSKKKGKTK